MNTEPVITAASLAALISAGIVFARLMGWVALSDEQFNALMVVVNLALPIAAGLWARTRVTPLTQPRDIDGAPLTRPDNTPALPAQGRMMQQARSEMQSDFFVRGLYK